MKDNYYFKKYGIDISCEIESLKVSVKECE